MEISEIKSSKDVFCTGEGHVQLTAIIKGIPTDIIWEIDGVEDPSNANRNPATFMPDHTTTYSVYAKNAVCITPAKPKTIEEANARIVITPRNFAICEGEWTPYILADTTGTGKLAGKFYISWERIVAKDTIFIDNDNGIYQHPDTTTIYRATVHHAHCSKNDEITVSINPLPTIISVLNEVSDNAGNIYAKKIETTFNVSGANNTMYYCVDDTTVFSTFCKEGDNVFINLPIGGHTLYVMDGNGCMTSQTFTVPEVPLDPPKFFTPGGLHNVWYIPGIYLYNKIDLRIFDRFGKELDKVTSARDWTGWNGIYLNKKLPSDDYWYILTLEETGKQYIGHFTLINKK